MIVRAVTAVGWFAIRLMTWAGPAFARAHWKVKATAFALLAIWIIRFHM